MWTKLANNNDWSDYRIANTPPWSIQHDGEPQEFPCLVSTEAPNPDLCRYIFIYEQDIKEMMSILHNQIPSNLEVIVAPTLTLEGVDHDDISLLVDIQEKRFIKELRQCTEADDQNHPSVLLISEKMGIPLEEALEMALKLSRRGFLTMATSPMILSPAEQKLMSLLIQLSQEKKQASFSIGTILKVTGGTKELLSALLISMHEKGLIICKNNRII